MKRNTQFVPRLSRILLALICAAVLINTPHAQQAAQTKQPNTEDRVALYQALLDLTNPWTVMCIAAHPDDEDGTSLIVMRHKYGAHTVSLFSTFGEGGQNAIGPELYEELGAIRARETMAAAEIQGSEPHFLGLKDFGYSKSADEAFRVWGHDEALRRMVLQIRKLRPDVIITNHSVTNNDHGHHQATARLELEAFDAAADPKRFPEQLKGDVTVWQVQRLFVRAGRSTQADNAPIVTIDPNERDTIRATTFAEEALRALQEHATQGPWPKTIEQMAARFSSSDGRLPLIRYRLANEAKGAPPLSKTPVTFFDGLKLSESFAQDIDVPKIGGTPLVEFASDRTKVSQALIQRSLKAYHFPSGGSDFQRLDLMQERIHAATTLAAGIVMKVSPANAIVTPNSSINLRIRIINRGHQTLYGIDCGSEIPELRGAVDPAPRSGATSVLTTFTELKSGAVFNKTITLKIPANASINLPLSSHLYHPLALGLQVVTRCSMSVRPSLIDGFNATARTTLDVAAPMEIASIVPSPLVLTPANFERVGMKTYGARPAVFSIKLINHQSSAFNGNLVATSSDGQDKPNNLRVTLAPGENKTLTMVIIPPAAGSLTFSLGNGKVNAPPRQVPIVTSNALIAGSLRVGYIRGFDFSLPNALTALGVDSKELSVDEVKTADLQSFSALIVDNRVYESKPELIAANQKLLDYAKAGGTLIVFYHKSNEWNPDERRNRPQLAPYKLILGDERITDETAPITFIEPQHPLLNFPNKMGQEDFANWIQERGLYYPKEWDPQFHALLQSNDPGEAPLKGGLLVADYGSGHYIYTSMVWYRELRAGVPGAYRMLANMISYGKTPR